MLAPHPPHSVKWNKDVSLRGRAPRVEQRGRRTTTEVMLAQKSAWEGDGHCCDPLRCWGVEGGASISCDSYFVCVKRPGGGAAVRTLISREARGFGSHWGRGLFYVQLAYSPCICGGSLSLLPQSEDVDLGDSKLR